MKTVILSDITSFLVIIIPLCLTMIFSSFFQYYDYPKHKSLDKIDRWYVFSFHDLTGGSMFQFVVTHSLFWKFNKQSDSVYIIETKPRIWYGHFFSRVINATRPKFNVIKLSKTKWKVRLHFEKIVPEANLVDLWHIHNEGRLIRSIKLRGILKLWGITMFGIGTGKATFISDYDFSEIDI
jgi:hypothetical protein